MDYLESKDLFEISQKYLNELGYKIKSISSYDGKYNNKITSIYQDIFYIVELKKSYHIYSKDEKYMIKASPEKISMFVRDFDREFKTTYLLQRKADWQKFLIKELGPKYITFMKKSYQDLRDDAINNYYTKIKNAKNSLEERIEEINAEEEILIAQKDDFCK